jgi:RNA polymerase sigma-70 factor (ECF subfamily)
MSTTSVSFLDRLRSRPDDRSWQRFVGLYTPLIRGWLRRQGVRADQAEDLTQEVLSVVVKELPGFRHDRRRGAFRCWLRTITVHRLRNFWRSQRQQPLARGGGAVEERLRQLEDPDSTLSRRWDEEHDRHVLRRLLELIEPEFSANIWQAFRRVGLQGERATDVGNALGMTVNAVLLAKSRVLRRLRAEAHGLVEGSEVRLGD